MINGQTAPRIIALYKKDYSIDEIFQYEKKASKLSKQRIINILKKEGLLNRWKKKK